MNEKILIEKLNNLKSIKPGAEWKKATRDVLLSQISAGESEKQPSAGISLGVYADLMKNFFSGSPLKRVSHSLAAAVALVIFVLGGGLASIRAAQDTKPGDSLYIAKIISEKTRSTLTFNEKSKAKLSLEFAGNRVKEMKQVMDENDESGKKEKQVEELAKNFQKEIESAKTRLEKIMGDAAVSENSEQADQAIAKNVPAENAAPAESGDKNAAGQSEDEVFSANLGKDKSGIKISEPAAGNEEKGAAENSAPKTDAVEVKNSSSTPAAANEEKTETVGDPKAILEEAEKMLEQEDYSTILNKLDAVSEIVENNLSAGDGGEVKGETEKATSTPEAEDKYKASAERDGIFTEENGE